MTRLAVLADIHGNRPALEAVIADMARFEVDHVVVAGDSVNCGPFSRDVLEIISERNWAHIRGNNAFYALDYRSPREPAHWSAFTLPPFLRAQLGEKWLNLLACLPDTISLRFPDAAPVRVFHGVPGNPWVSINPLSAESEIERWLAPVAEDTVICAHSHIPMERHVGRWHIFNPGSIGIPLDGLYHASYMILDGDHKRLAPAGPSPPSLRPKPRIFEAFDQQRFVQRCGVTAMLLVQEFESARMRLWPFIQWKNANFPDQADSVAMYRRFSAP